MQRSIFDGAKAHLGIEFHKEQGEKEVNVGNFFSIPLKLYHKREEV